MTSAEGSEHASAAQSSLISGNLAYKTGKFRQAIACWSQILQLSRTDTPAILTSRSAAYGRLSLWEEALCDAEQAVQLQPDNVKALYRLAQAQHSLKQYKQCIQSCSTALLFRPAAAQLHCLLQQATDALRLGFLATRHPDIEQALRQAAGTAAQQASYTQLQKELQHQHCSKQKSAAHHRKLEDAMQKEQFAHWHQCRPECCNSQPSSETAMTGSPQAARTLFGVTQHASPEDIRRAYVRAAKLAHPDKGGSAERFHQVQAAYECLTKSSFTR